MLFGVDLEVDEGECVALLGTNGAGKSTLLRAISGVVEADRGVVLLDGREITHAPPHEIAALGVAQVPGRPGVFPTLTVAENLRLAAWLDRRRPGRGRRRHRAGLRAVPGPRRRGPTAPPATCPAASSRCWPSPWRSSAKPRLLLIDELSLGLAPAVVAAAAPARRRDARERARRSCSSSSRCNVALQVAQTAVFLEKGEIRFRGPDRRAARPARRAALGVPRGRRPPGFGDRADGAADGAPSRRSPSTATAPPVLDAPTA